MIFPKRPLQLWDLDLLLREQLKFPNLKSIIDASPLNAIWGYQKIPKISQLVGNFLRIQGGDGIAYPSTKEPESKIYALFAKDGAHMINTFKVKLLNDEERA